MKFEGFRQDKGDQLEDLLNTEEYEDLDTYQRSSKKLKRKTLS